MRLWKEQFPGVRSLLLTGSEPTETRLVQELSGHWQYVHVATHGFFASPTVLSALAPREDDAMGLIGFGSTHAGWRRVGYDPLLLSGIALAGANRPTDPNSVPDGRTDGILTAAEVQHLDLTGTKLVVLSACETGLGKVAGGEGVFGLQRAFALSGAETLVTSLWKVPDEQTQTLMTRFYTNLWDKKMGKLEALREAQLALLNRQLDSSSTAAPDQADQPRAPGAPESPAGQPELAMADPYYWAAWVLSGDPGDLSFLARQEPSPLAVAQVTDEPSGADTDAPASAPAASTGRLLIITVTVLAAVLVLAAVVIGLRTHRQAHR